MRVVDFGIAFQFEHWLDRELLFGYVVLVAILSVMSVVLELIKVLN